MFSSVSQNSLVTGNGLKDKVTLFNFFLFPLKENEARSEALTNS